jgi:hypothetical protein
MMADDDDVEFTFSTPERGLHNDLLAQSVRSLQSAGARAARADGEFFREEAFGSLPQVSLLAIPKVKRPQKLEPFNVPRMEPEGVLTPFKPSEQKQQVGDAERLRQLRLARRRAMRKIRKIISPREQGENQRISKRPRRKRR